MKREYEQLIGALIGIARAVDGNEHLITPSATALIRACLRGIREDIADAEQLMVEILEEKRKIVPDCFVCANPCGRTSPFDLSQIPEGEIRQLKFTLLDALCCCAETVDEALLYRCLAVIGIEDYEREELLPLLHQLS